MTFEMAALPKHSLIFQRLHQEIKRGRYKDGARLPSELALARRFDASRPTVAQALRELQRLELVERHRGAGTFVRSPPPSTGNLGLLADGLGATEVLEPISVAVSRAARAAGWNVIMGAAMSDRPPDLIAREWADCGVKGVFFAPIEHHPVRESVNRNLVSCMKHHGLSVVLLDRDIGEFPDRSANDLVAIDDFFAGFELADHLLSRGCRRIVFAARREFPSTTDLRLAGARAAVERAGKALIEFSAGDPEDVAWLEKVMKNTDADAFIASNDATAARIMLTLKNLKRQVPAEIKVAGFDDVRYASLLSPALTTMRQPCAALGAAALEAMLGRLRQPDMPGRRVLLRAELVVRASTGDR
jgi:LacI family transcriptional regulator